MARDIAERIPPSFDIDAASLKYPVTYSNSLNNFLIQEMVRFNRSVTSPNRYCLHPFYDLVSIYGYDIMISLYVLCGDRVSGRDCEVALHWEWGDAVPRCYS